MERLNYNLTFSKRLSAYLRRSKFLRFGLPMIVFTVLGSFGLAEFTSVKIKRRDEKNRMLTAEETLSFQKKKRQVDVEEEFMKLQEELDIEQWRTREDRDPGRSDHAHTYTQLYYNEGTEQHHLVI